MIIFTMFTFFFIMLFIAFILALVEITVNAVQDNKITRVDCLDQFGNKMSFVIDYNNGKRKIETVKIGTPRYNKLRGMVNEV